MTKNDFIEKFKIAIEAENQAITEQSEIFEIQGFDSLSLMRLVAFLDSEFQRTISGDELRNLKIVGNLMNYLDVE